MNPPPQFSVKVSVIIPVYNAEKHLRECLDSVISQTLREIEIICVDDGSADSSPKILAEYAEKDPRVRVLSQKNAGAGAARNRGLDAARGEYLSFLDSDDFFEPEMLKKAYLKISETSSQVVVFRSDQYREDMGKFVRVSWTLREKALPPCRPMNARSFTDNVFKVFVGWAWDKLFERRFVLENRLRFQEIRTSNDMLFVFSAIVLAPKIEIVDEILAHQRRNNPDSLSNTREKSWDCFHSALNALKTALEERGIFRRHEQDYINYALHFSLWHYNTITGPKKKVLFQKLKRKWWKEFGVAGKPETYFYDKKEFAQYRRDFLGPAWRPPRLLVRLGAMFILNKTARKRWRERHMDLTPRVK